MILTLKCDKCGLVGTPETIAPDTDFGDACDKCLNLQLIADLEDRLASEKKDLELRGKTRIECLEEQIKDLKKNLL